jgi:hypothetical protein
MFHPTPTNSDTSTRSAAARSLPPRRRAIRVAAPTAFGPRLLDHPRTNLAIGVFAITALAATGCAANDDEMSAAACDSYAALQASFFGDPALMVDAADDFGDVVPEAYSDDVGVLVDALSSDDPEAMASAEVVEANRVIGDAVFESCEVTTAIDVDGIDYAFDGLPTSIDAGRTALRLHNRSETEQPHEIVIVTGTDGQSADELRDLPLDQLMQQARPVAVAFVDAPGSSSTTLVDLDPGSYLLICALPVDEDGGSHDGDGPPSDTHASHGMVATLTVA